MTPWTICEPESTTTWFASWERTRKGSPTTAVGRNGRSNFQNLAWFCPRPSPLCFQKRFNPLPKGASSAKQTEFNAGYRAIENLGYLLVAQLLKITQNDHLPMGCR